MPPTVGVLALHGGVEEHVTALRAAGCGDVRLVRTAADMRGLAGLVLPGGESSVMEVLLERDCELRDCIDHWIAQRKPTLGTCAGLVLMARRGLTVEVQRNAYGAQLESCRTDVRLEVDGKCIILKNAAFVRAPGIAAVNSEAHAFAWRGQETVGVQQGNLFAVSFHPELTESVYLHSLFLSACTGAPPVAEQLLQP